MGRKRSWSWKYIYLCVACLISIFMTGCGIPENIRKTQEHKEASAHLLRAKELLTQQDYEGSLMENQKVLSILDNKPPADEALFNIGLIYSHYGYQKRDYNQSLSFHRRLVGDFPGSPLVEQAKIWIGVIEAIEKTKQVDIDLDLNKEADKHLLRAKELLARQDYEGSLKESQRVLSILDNKSPADEALFNIGLIYSHYGYQKRDYKKSLTFHKRLVRDFPKSTLLEQAKIWIGVIEVIEKIKQVDIDIEEKKKELSR